MASQQQQPSTSAALLHPPEPAGHLPGQLQPSVWAYNQGAGMEGVWVDGQDVATAVVAATAVVKHTGKRAATGEDAHVHLAG